MSDFKKGLTIGILLMSSVFLLMAQTKTEDKKIEKRILRYQIVPTSGDSNEVGLINTAIDLGWVPFGSPILTMEGITKEIQTFYQPMVSYEKRFNYKQIKYPKMGN